MIGELGEQIARHLPVITANQSEASVIVVIRDFSELRDNASGYNCR